MALIDLYSERNVENSVGVYFASQLKAMNYLVYWYSIDAVETPDGLYTNYSLNQDSYLADATFLGRANAAVGLATLVEGDTELPVFLGSAPGDGTVAPQGKALVPSFGIAIGPDVVLRPFEHGSLLKWRVRVLTIDARLRDKTELQTMSDKFAAWFFEDICIDVADHDGNEPTDSVRVTRTNIVKDIVPDGGEAERFQVELMARLEYVA